MPRESRLVRMVARNRARVDPDAAKALGEQVVFGFFCLGGGRRGAATAIIGPVAGGALGEMAARGAGEVVSHLTEVATEAVEGIAEAVKRENADQARSFRGSKGIRIKYRKQYYIAIGASKVGIFRLKGIFRLRGAEPVVVIPREAIRKVEFHDGFRSFLWSFCQVLPIGPGTRKWTITLDDGGKLNFWLVRWGQLGRVLSAGISAAFPSTEPVAVGAPTRSA